MSRLSDQAPIYVASTRARCSGVDISRPCTCATPVIPGRRRSTPCCRRHSANSNCVGSPGRGPTKLISPRRTFQICGSSSSLVRRKIVPVRVMLLGAALCDGISPVPTCIVRNLINENVRPLRPSLHCTKNGLARSSSQIATAASAHRIAAGTARERATVRSNARLPAGTPKTSRMQAFMVKLLS